MAILLLFEIRDKTRSTISASSLERRKRKREKETELEFPLWIKYCVKMNINKTTGESFPAFATVSLSHYIILEMISYVCVLYTGVLVNSECIVL